MKLTHICTLGLAFCFLACHNSSGGSSPTAAATYSSQPQGAFSVSQQLPSGDTTRFTVGCTQAGAPGGPNEIDPRLKVGMDFTTTYTGMTSTSSLGLILDSVIASVSSTAISENVKVLAVSGIPTVQPGFTTTNSCTLDPTQGLQCTANPSPPNFTLPNTCGMTSYTSAATELIYSGSFTTVSGKTFTAFKIVDHVAGPISCGSTSEGTGTSDIIQIVSNDLPAEGTSSYCGGVALFLTYDLKKDDGTLLDGMTVERTAVK